MNEEQKEKVEAAYQLQKEKLEERWQHLIDEDYEMNDTWEHRKSLYRQRTEQEDVSSIIEDADIALKHCSHISHLDKDTIISCIIYVLYKTHHAHAHLTQKEIAGIFDTHRNYISEYTYDVISIVFREEYDDDVTADKLKELI